MSVLDKINESIEAMQDFKALTNAHELVSALKGNIRKKLGDNFSKVYFDKTDANNGMVFVKFSKFPYMNEATNEKLQEAPVNFIISVEGFDGEGNVCQECGGLMVEMVRFKNVGEGKLRKLRVKQFSEINMVKDYVNKYFEKNEGYLAETVGTTSGASGTADATGEMTGGKASATQGDIAVFKKPLKDKKEENIVRR